MRLFCALAACVVFGCASRSRLSLVDREDAPTVEAAVLDAAPETSPPDVFVETWSREADAAACSARDTLCLGGDDFGPSKRVRAVFETCSAESAAACGDLAMVFDAEGCLVALQEIREYSQVFVDCVLRVTSVERWQCASGRTLRMLQQCPS